MENLERLLDFIKFKRNELNITQKEIADKLGVTNVQYSRLETGKSSMTVIQLLKIIQVLKIKRIDNILCNGVKDINDYLEESHDFLTYVNSEIERITKMYINKKKEE